MADSPHESEREDEQQATHVDLAKMKKYIRKITLIFFDDDDFLDTQKPLDTALSDPANNEFIKRFISDSQIRAIVVRGSTNKDDEEEGEKVSVTFDVSLDIAYTGSKTSGVVFCKFFPVVEADKSITSQLSVHQVNAGSPYQYFHTFVSSTMSPYFKSFIKDTGRTTRDNEQMVLPVEKKISELEMGLLHLQQNIGIPEINLVIHPTVAQNIKAAVENNRKAKVADFGSLIEDAQFLNALQSGVTRWIREIQKVTKLDRDPSSGTALQEISFWLNLERALIRIQEKRDAPEITLTLEILKHAKRFHATLSFDTDTGLKHALEKVNDYNPLMKDFPLHDLLAASELDRINLALQAIFNHMKKIRNTRYPVVRALRLVEAISTDLMNQIMKVLASPKLTLVVYEEFETIMSKCFVIFNTWDEDYDKVNVILRDIMKKKRDESLRMVWKLNPVHKKLQARLEQMRKFRKQHDQLIQVIARVLKPATVAKNVEGAPGDAQTTATEQTAIDSTEAQAIEEVNLAYENVKEVDCLDVTKEGNDAWESAMKRYDERIDRVETRITARLRDQLGLAKNANEMFRIFSRFNALFVRPHIRGAIREYQTQLMQRVKDDIEVLHDKFKVQYSHSRSFSMSDGRDVPPISGQIIWLRQIESELEALMSRVEAVLGKDWAQHVEGQKLKQDGDSFKVKLNTSDLFDDWCRKVGQRQLSINGNIFVIESHRSRTAGKPHQLKLRVNFHPEIITLSKEVRNLKGLGFRIPLNIVNKAHQANQLYPNAISMIDSVRMYEQTCKKVDDRERVALLVAGLRRDCQEVILEGCSGVVWESYKIDPFVKKMAEQFYAFQDRVEELLLIDEEITVEVRALGTCAYSANTFKDIIEKIQKAVDSLSLKQYSNLGKWVERLDKEIEAKLVVRLEAAIKAWTGALLGLDEENEVTMDTEESKHSVHNKLGGEPKIMRAVHELRMQNGEIVLHPAVEEAREKMLRELFSWQAIILTLPRISHKRYQVGLANEDGPSNDTYRSLLANLPGGQIVLEESYDAMEKIMKEVISYTDTWKRYKSLWSASIAQLYSKLGTKLKQWMTTLHGIRNSRKMLDSSDVRRCFGPVVIEYGKVQSKVMLKFDNWHKEVLNSFGKLLNEQMIGFHREIAKSRTDLEAQTLETSSTSDAVHLITFVQNLKRKHTVWDQLVQIYGNGQQVLERHRFAFPNEWLYAENVAGEWGAFSDIMKRKEANIQTQIAALQNKIIAEDKVVEEKTTGLLSEWEVQRPVQGNLKPDEASKVLSVFEGRFGRLKEERDNLRKAKEALELSQPDQVSASDDRMQVGLEELQDLKGVWSELSKVWDQIDEMKEKTWLSVAPRKLRTQLDALLSQLRDMPARLRHYPSYEFVKKLLQSYAKVNAIITELKSDAVKDRHWKSLMKQLRVRWTLSELTLGHVWDVDIERNERVIRDVLLVAQGERALEEFLRQVSECWRTYNLDLINYQNKCKLIRGWDELFEKVKEHINSVSAMKLSPYYKEFEEEATNWADRLNRIHDCFDIWIDVQRRWVYLEGIFSGSADIKNLLPVETSRFTVVGTEFLALMKKVAKNPAVLEVVNIPSVQKQLDRLADLLNKIQKALGEYLERERASFPRFYFVGDEDLLEIIGNSKNIPRLQKHFKKMFAGVAMILLNEDNTVVTGIASKEGEEVVFHKPVSITEHPKINEWLTLVEKEMRNTLARLLAQSVQDCAMFLQDKIDTNTFNGWLDSYQSQLIVLSLQILWSEKCDASLSKVAASPAAADFSPLQSLLDSVQNMLNVLAESVLHEQPPVRRMKLEHLIIECVHMRDVTRTLLKNRVSSNKSFEWLAQMRFYFDPKTPDVLEQLSIQMANAKFNYGFEYLGVQEKLVQTPLTDRCYLTMTQALHARLGGSPFGPAGTGKTESVKALGNILGRFVLVFNCDETFDFQAMGRIFVGLCQVGAWGCFDEFNRLEERMLSACSQQIQTIQEALTMQAATSVAPGQKASQIVIELVGKQVKVNPDMAIFITMNPDYAGRSNLPDNLKKLFRSLAMTQPDRQLIAEVMLYSQGFKTAEKLASKIVPFFKLCLEQLSSQSHYDFGLRALKSVLISAGNVKRERIMSIKEQAKARGEAVNEEDIAVRLPEQEILIQSVMETVVPKLVADDIPLLHSLLTDVFPGMQYAPAAMTALREEISKVCDEEHLVCGEAGSQWMEKVLQLFQITQLHHGLMMVGPSGSGKSSAWRVLLKALQRLEGVEGVSHVIDPKSISKDHLYGNLDPNTREWTDGLFTHILRRIIDNVRGEINKRQWIIFDGDVDPEWVENLNSVLDNNKLLTLPNGERLAIPPNVRIMFEVQDLRYATLATVSRCGMVWFSEDVLTNQMIFSNFLLKLRSSPMEETEEDVKSMSNKTEDGQETVSPTLSTQRDAAAVLEPFFQPDCLVDRCLAFASKLEHIMDFTRLRALSSLFSMLNDGVRSVLNYNSTHSDFPMSQDVLEQYASKWLVFSLIWSFAGDGKFKIRNELGDFIRSSTTITLPPANTDIIDYEVTLEGKWSAWSSRVPQIEIETHRVAATDLVVPTIDTVRHEHLLYSWLAEHKPIVLCGPPGSGKTMTLFSALRSLPDMEVVGLNFSSATTPELMLKTFDHYCEYRRTPNGVVLSPIQLNKWLIVFCDEINLPSQDRYGTQRVISFLRQMLEHGGFYRTSDQTFVKLDRIQFVGACNPPTDPGRVPMTHRFLRHVPVVYVDYPAAPSLKQIYGTFNRAMMRLVPELRAYADPLTNAMVEFYTMSQENFTQDMQPHYIYSPREMTRWVRGIHEALKPLESLSVEGLVRIWAHEALRLFQDRLVTDEERMWTDTNIDKVAMRHFPNVDFQKALTRPILYSNWLHKDYVPVDREELRDYVKARLKVFYEEELDVPLVLFNEVLDHVLRIDRIFRQPQGHLLLIGVSGAGKTTLSRFVAWMNGLSVFQIKMHNKYTGADFDDDLRAVLRRAGCRSEKIAFIMDESNIKDSGFLERMNTLLANGEVPGLFEGDEYTTLMTQCKEGAQRMGQMLDSSEELYKWFTSQVITNLHVVFTMNPSTEGLKDRASTSPALFNRCVLNWFGDWSTGAFYQVAREFTNKIDLENSNYLPPDDFPVAYEELPMPPSHRHAIINAMVYVHKTLFAANERITKKGGRTAAITPRHYLDFISQYVKLYNEKRSELEEQQLHLNVGLGKIRDTFSQVEELQKSLSVKRAQLKEKDELANQKLKQMLADQQEAEKRKITSQELHKDLQEQQKKISQKQKEVMEDLAKVEPAVMEAQQAVKSIKKQQLTEVRSLANPPPAIKLAVEAIAVMLGETDVGWKALRQLMMRETFISTIVNFDTEQMSDEVAKKMRTQYLTNPDFTYEKVNRASLACGPMVKWATAQLGYADMIRRVEPLRAEMRSLERSADVAKVKSQEVDQVISGLERSISKYKEEYAILIADVQAIKSDLASVEKKVHRSVALLESLSQEKERWDEGCEGFKQQMSTILSDCLINSAFLAYAGYYDQHMRDSLFLSWQSHLHQANLKYKDDIARIEYLCNADERLRWTANALPSDNLCVENAIMLRRFNRFPLIIDPSGQATQFLENEFKEKHITKTSFLDDAFRKNLESALRFGNPLLVQDVENYDPILNPVLNHELRRTGGRVLITLGDQDIDFIPSFTIFLTTRDPTVEFPPDIASRVSFVNFTVTRASLQSQCLNKVLKSERPDVDQKKADLLKLQGEFQLRLRQLEKSLLQALNDVKGRILDDDSIITHLETLKTEAREVTTKVEETDSIMAEVEAVSQQYMPLANSCSSVYFTLESLNQVHFLYQYSLQFFLDIFDSSLTTDHLTGIKGYQERLKVISSTLFQTAFNRVARGMLHNDQIGLAVHLSRIELKQSAPSAQLYEAEFQHFLRAQSYATGAMSAIVDSSQVPPAGLSPNQFRGVTQLSALPAFKDLLRKLDSPDFQAWLQTDAPEMNVPTLWDVTSTLTPVGESLHKLLIIQALRPDRLVSMSHSYVSTSFGPQFFHDVERELDMAYIVENEVKANTPVLMCSVPGYDASGRVMDLAAQLGKQLTDIAIGSAEGFSHADKAINSAIKTGRWVMLKNVHLAPSWLIQLEKKLHSLQPSPVFRLFLTMEINPRLPTNLLRAGRVFVFEPPPGVRANLLRTFSQVPSQRMAKAPVERARLYFLLAWFHAIVQERLTYAPLGWSKKYEFNESDLKCACDTLDTWIDSTAKGRSNLPPEKVPWDALRSLLGMSIYGGRIDNDFDQRLLDSFIEKVFTPATFTSDFTLVPQGNGVVKSIGMPDGIRREQFVQWADNLMDTQTPAWLGLPNNAEKLLLTNQGTYLVSQLLKMQLLDDDEELAYQTSKKDKTHRQTSVPDGRPAWMRQLLKSVSDWLKMIPQSLTLLRRTADNIKDPLFRFFEREVSSAARLLADVRRDMQDVILVCQGEKKATNHLRQMNSDLTKGIIPQSWKRYTVPAELTVIQWITDFTERIKQFQAVSKASQTGGLMALKNLNVWLGGLFVPEAYITATRQYVAQANSWSLEELSLQVTVTESSQQKAALDVRSFGVTGLSLHGATCTKNVLSVSSTIQSELPLCLLSWVRLEGDAVAAAVKDQVTLPVYLNPSRAQLLFTLNFSVDVPVKGHNFYERGVALTCSKLG